MVLSQRVRIMTGLGRIFRRGVREGKGSFLWRVKLYPVRWISVPAKAGQAPRKEVWEPAAGCGPGERPGEDPDNGP